LNENPNELSPEKADKNLDTQAKSQNLEDQNLSEEDDCKKDDKKNDKKNKKSKGKNAKKGTTDEVETKNKSKSKKQEVWFEEDGTGVKETQPSKKKPPKKISFDSDIEKDL